MAVGIGVVSSIFYTLSCPYIVATFAARSLQSPSYEPLTNVQYRATSGPNEQTHRGRWITSVFQDPYGESSRSACPKRGTTRAEAAGRGLQTAPLSTASGTCCGRDVSGRPSTTLKRAVGSLPLL